MTLGWIAWQQAVAPTAGDQKIPGLQNAEQEFKKALEINDQNAQASTTQALFNTLAKMNSPGGNFIVGTYGGNPFTAANIPLPTSDAGINVGTFDINAISQWTAAFAQQAATIHSGEAAQQAPTLH